MTIHKHLTPDDFILIVRPVLEEVNPDDFEDDNPPVRHWTGEVIVGIVADDKKTNLSDEEWEGMTDLCNHIANSIPAMEENSIVREIITTYARKNSIIPVPEALSPYTDNILTFTSDTEGSA